MLGNVNQAFLSKCTYSLILTDNKYDIEARKYKNQFQIFFKRDNAAFTLNSQTHCRYVSDRLQATKASLSINLGFGVLYYAHYRITTRIRMSEREAASDEVRAVTTAADSSLTLIDSSLYHQVGQTAQLWDALLQ